MNSRNITRAQWQASSWVSGLDAYSEIMRIPRHNNASQQILQTSEDGNNESRLNLCEN
jgi:hypothetical protein